jgi:sarcosine oxidase gamma subunit
VVDASAGWAGLRVRGATLMRRLTDLDLDALPAMGPLAHVQALVIHDDGETFRLYFAQEYGDSVAEAVLDAAEGLTL